MAIKRVSSDASLSSWGSGLVLRFGVKDQPDLKPYNHWDCSSIYHICPNPQGTDPWRHNQGVGDTGNVVPLTQIYKFHDFCDTICYKGFELSGAIPKPTEDNHAVSPGEDIIEEDF